MQGTSGVLTTSANQRRGFLSKIAALGLSTGLMAGFVLAAGGGSWLAVGILGLMVVVVTVARPDLAVAALIFFLPLVGSFDIVSASGLPDITVGRALVLWSAVVVANAIRLQSRQPGPHPSRELMPDVARNSLPAWVGAFLVIMLLAGLRSSSLHAGLQDWLDEYLLPFGLLLLFCRYRWTQRETDLVVTAYLLCCCLWSALALVEFLENRSFFTAGGALPWGSVGPFGRTRGPFINPAFMGTAVGIGLVLAWVWAAGRGASPRMTLVWLVSLPMCVIGLAVSLTRASWLGALAGIVVISVLAGRRRAVMTLLLLAGLGIGILLVVSFVGATVFQSRTDSMSEVFNRVVVQRSALNIIADNPLIGIGSGNFASVSRRDLQNVGSISGSYGIGVSVPHNSILGTTVDGGLGATVSVLVVVGLLVAAARRRLANREERYLGIAALGCIVVVAVNAMFIDMAIGSQVTILAVAMVSILLATSGSHEMGER